ncbi:hypothetical protein [Wolbachia endosymbiont of Litomosoides brasiliensis]|nr:hypothetical protein [Wolbachia endosymbiont of Litomosoides brasiliensis]
MKEKKNCLLSFTTPQKNYNTTNQEMRIRIQENLISKSTVHRLFC